jgi:hypothetical protein
MCQRHKFSKHRSKNKNELLELFISNKNQIKKQQGRKREKELGKGGKKKRGEREGESLLSLLLMRQ